MPEIPTIEPFQFIRSTAFSERVQLANKLNEVIDALNQIGTVDDLQTQIDALSSTVSTIQAGLASTDADLDSLTQQVNSLISEVNDTIKAQITALQGDVTALDSRMDTAESDISGLDSEVQGLLAEVVDGVAMSSTAHGTVQVQINHEDGSNDISQPIDLGLVEQGGITLISGTTDRSFKLHVELTDGSAWETNDMIIPPGGGTEVTVTGITLHTGTSDSYLQASIVLSDSTTIDSNDFAIVTTAQFTQLSNRVTTAEGTIAQHTTQITGLDDRVEALEQAGGYVLVPATSVVLGGVKIGTGITVASDGTISIPNVSASQNGLMTSADKAHLDAAATAATFMFTADASKVTAHLDSVSGSEFSEEIPQASQGGAGTIDYASYQKIAANEAAISEVEADVAALAPSVSVNEAVDPPTITVGINGKTAQANLPGGGEQWEELDLSSLPTDFTTDDVVLVHFIAAPEITTTPSSISSWDTPITGIVPTSELYSINVWLLMSPKLSIDCYPLIGSFTDTSNPKYILLEFFQVSTVGSWNGEGQNPEIGRFLQVAFNGGGSDTSRDYTENIVSHSKLSTFVDRMYRKKK